MGEITNYFENTTIEYVLPKLQQYSTQAKQYIKEIIQYEAQLANTEKKGSWFLPENQTTSKILEKERKVYDQLANPIKQLQKAEIQIQKNNAQIRKTIINSYILINKIGELFHEPITYSITLPTANQGHITFEMPISVFVKQAVTVGYNTGIQLKNSQSLLNSLLNSRSKQIKSYNWIDQKNDWYNETNFQDFLYEIKVAAQGNVNINFPNAGIQLESYFHWTNAGIYQRNMANLARQTHLGITDFNSMVNELKIAQMLGSNNTPYWASGDIGNKQIKGVGADVTDIQSLKQQLLRFTTMTTALDLSALKNKLNSVKDTVDDSVITEVTKQVNGLANAFLNHFQFSKQDIKQMGLTMRDLV